MDLAAFGCRAVVLLAPRNMHKPSLKPRGEVGAFLGRSRDSKGCYAVMVEGRVRHSSSVVVDEKNSSISRRLFLRRFFVFVVFVFGTTFPTASSSSFIRWRRGGWR